MPAVAQKSDGRFAECHRLSDAMPQNTKIAPKDEDLGNLLGSVWSLDFPKQASMRLVAGRWQGSVRN